MGSQARKVLRTQGIYGDEMRKRLGLYIKKKEKKETTFEKNLKANKPENGAMHPGFLSKVKSKLFGIVRGR